MTTTQAVVLNAINHVMKFKPDWQAGLNPADAAALDEVYRQAKANVTGAGLPGLLQPVDDKLLTSLRKANPTLFDGDKPINPPGGTPPATVPAAGEPPPPAAQPGGDGFEGKAADASKRVDDALAKTGTAIAKADEELVDAVLGAKTGSEESKSQLRTLQQSLIDEIHKLGPTLDTPAGQQQLNEFLQSKTQEILGIAKSSGMDASSKADVLGALAQRYDALQGGGTDPKPASATAATAQSPTAATDPGRAAASDTGTSAAFPNDPLLNGLGSDPTMTGLGSLASPAMGALASLPGMMGSMVPSFGGLGGGGSGLPLSDLGGALSGALRQANAPDTNVDPHPEAKLTAQDHPDTHDDGAANGPDNKSGSATPAAPEAAGAAKPGDHPLPVAAVGGAIDPKTAAAAPDVAVKLPDGSTVIADNPQIAQAGRLLLKGSSFGDAFAQAGLPQPPPGTPVGTPVSPGQLRFGDYARYTDHQVMVVNPDKAWLNGQVVPISEVPTGQNFLGWTRPTTTATPAPVASPTATVPAGAQ